MPKTIRTSDSLAVDREFDDILRRLAALEKHGTIPNTQPRPAQFLPLVGLVVQDSSGNPSIQAQGIEFNSADGLVITEDGIYALVTLNAFTGDSGAGGAKGSVPAPAAGDAAALKFLKADGTWAVPAGGTVQTVQTKSGNYTALSTDWWVIATGTSITITLPLSANTTHPIGVVATNAAGLVTVARSGSDTINAATTKVITSQFDSYIFVPDGGTGWFIF